MNALTKKTATLLAAAALTTTFIGCSSSDDSPDQPPSEKISCIHQNLAAGTNTLDDVGEACGASKSEVLAQLQPEVGTCDKNDLDFGKPIGEIMEECGASEIAIDIPSSSSQGKEVSGSSSAVVIEKIYGDDLVINGTTYKTVVIGSQTWMAKNLNYNFVWNEAMKACPSGWHLPSRDEWKELTDYVNSENKCTTYCADKHLRDVNYKINGVDDYGLDTYGFAAMFGSDGYYNVDQGGFIWFGFVSAWWSASDIDDDNAYAFLIGFMTTNNYNKNSKFSVRCVKD